MPVATNADVVLEDFGRPIHNWDVMDTSEYSTQDKHKTVLTERGGKVVFEGGLGPSNEVQHSFNEVTHEFETIRGDPFALVFARDTFPRLAGCMGLEVTLQPLIAGYRYYIGLANVLVSTAEGDIKVHQAGDFDAAEWGAFYIPTGDYHAQISAPGTDKYTVTVPFTDFSNRWTTVTGEITTKCSEDPQVCPPAHALDEIMGIAIWAQGLMGDFSVDLYSIKAVGGTC